MSKLLDYLREEAIELAEHELPTVEESRPLLASLIRYLEDGLGVPVPEQGDEVAAQTVPVEPVAPPAAPANATTDIRPSQPPLTPEEQAQLAELQRRAATTGQGA